MSGCGLMPSVSFFLLPSFRKWPGAAGGTSAPGVLRVESANAQTAHGDGARFLDVARPIDEVTLPQAVRRLVRTHAAEGRTHPDCEGLERTRIIQRCVRHAVMQERFGRNDA